MKNLIISFFLIISGLFVQAQDIPNRPNPPRLVNDYMGWLSQSEVANLEQKLQQFARET
ncbi:MAG: TPM domain-containing protein, partial [Bacteroidetes bacterium]|nr:TPM domain-containing protein [Bacteroidota bacterium]